MQIGSTPPVQGMQRASEQMDRAAATIASPVPTSARGSDPSPAPPTGNQGLTAAQASGDQESALADAVQARRAYEANARALERHDAIERRAISLGA